jgi:hypothetical protein
MILQTNTDLMNLSDRGWGLDCCPYCGIYMLLAIDLWDFVFRRTSHNYCIVSVHIHYIYYVEFVH